MLYVWLLLLKWQTLVFKLTLTIWKASLKVSFLKFEKDVPTTTGIFVFHSLKGSLEDKALPKDGDLLFPVALIFQHLIMKLTGPVKHWGSTDWDDRDIVFAWLMIVAVGFNY